MLLTEHLCYTNRAEVGVSRICVFKYDNLVYNLPAPLCVAHPRTDLSNRKHVTGLSL
jgi:hypothetical protein